MAASAPDPPIHDRPGDDARAGIDAAASDAATDEDTPRLLRAIGLQRLSAGDLEGALRIYLRLLEREPTPANVEQVVALAQQVGHKGAEAITLAKLVSLQLDAGELDASLRTLQRLLFIGPSALRTYRRVATLLQDLGRGEDAARCLMLGAEQLRRVGQHGRAAVLEAEAATLALIPFTSLPPQGAMGNRSGTRPGHGELGPASLPQREVMRNDAEE